jgi:ATP-binding cassette subfamily F protein 3
MIDISCSNLKKSYVSDLILSDVNFTINESEKVALVGLNGSGKTTLLKIITSELEYDSGSIYINSSKKVGYLKQSIIADESLSVYDATIEVFKDLISLENQIRKLEYEMAKNSNDDNLLSEIMNKYSEATYLFEKNEGYSYQSKTKGVLFGLGFEENDLSIKFSNLSGGQKNRVMLAKLLLSSPEILLLDEPTNHLDIESIEWLEKFLRDFEGTILVISHDRYFLDKITNRTLFLQNSKLYSYNGNYSYFIKKWYEEQELQSKKYILQEKEIQRQKEIISKMLANGRDKKVRQAKSREKLLQNMILIDKPESESEKLNIKFNPSLQSGSEVLFADKLSKFYSDMRIFDNISFNIYRGEKIGLIGPNGVGKSTLVKIIKGEISEYSGEFSQGHNVKIGYFDQELSDLNMENSVIDEIWDEYPSLKTHEVRGYLAKFMFYNEDLFKSVNDLSGGEKTRLSILKLMLSNSNFLIMDEPTNHLDIDSKDILEKALKDYTGTVLIISHDRYFLNNSVTKILEMKNDGIIEYLGNYDYYIYKKNISIDDDEIDDTVTKTELKNLAKKQRESIRQKQAERKRLSEIEKEIYQIEDSITTNEEKLCNPEVYSNHIFANQLSNEIERFKRKLEELYKEWDMINQ